MKIVDCFPFYNEFRMLDFRLRELAGAVDHFVLAESDVTFSGRPKEMMFRDRRAEFSAHPVQYVGVTDTPETESAWDREYWQRNAVARGLESLNLDDNDIVMMNDVDEVPDPQTLLQLKESGLDGPRCLEQDFYYYSLRCRYKYIKWIHPKIMPYGFFKGLANAQHARSYPSPALQRGGWHFSFFGDSEFIANKIRSFSHQEFNTEQFTDKSWIEARIAEGSDLFGRGYDFEAVDPESNPYLPSNWRLLA